MYTHWGTTPRNSRGRGSAVCVFFSDSPGDVVIVVDYSVSGGSWFDWSFFYCMSAGHHSDSTPDNKCAPILCPRLLYRAFCTVQAVLQTATLIAAVLVVSNQ